MVATRGTILLAAGGTGGHLFPAYALAEELARRGYTVDLATDMRGDRYGTGFPARAIHQLPAATLAGKSPLAVASTALTLSRGVAAAVSLLGEVRPRAVVGFGGYPSFPPLLAARLRGVRSALHEQNAVLGRANRMLARRVDVIATSFPDVKFVGTALEAKVRLTGNPVRDTVIASAAEPYAAPVSPEPIRLLVFGGSQGARYFSQAVPPALAMLPADLRARLDVTQQAREEDIGEVTAAYRKAGIRADVAAFFKDLPRIMAAAHLVVARAGASSVAELTVIGRPSILVPLPHALDNDQLQNAAHLAESGGAWCIEQKDLSPERLASELNGLFDHPGRLAEAARCARLQGRPEAVIHLADVVEELAGETVARLRAG
ncbi:MAG: undecaprenyldiphospho-muramoylpentapeptide beta-N-acetylglucosaminyltransferase [Hyphomicrobiaceae bacterium]|nr:undecaprenyldiphospho-muramoylpentapeptide beta-N-acetylglucosaminyltransferase [Hyphomicrobiaceae bacterium]